MNLTLMARRLFETWGPRLGVTRGRERPRAPRGDEGARAQFDRGPARRKGRAILETVEAENRVAISHGRAPVPLGPGAQPRHPGGVPGPRVPDPLSDALDPEAISKRTCAAIYQDDLERGTASRRSSINDVWPENYSANSAAKGLGGEVRGAAPERRRCSTSRASSAGTTRPRTVIIDNDRRARRRRPTRRSTTSTRTSRAAASRSA
jgi:hypothetical protein